jgi:uncharacterized protein YbjT (DUF2867 family)
VNATAAAGAAQGQRNALVAGASGLVGRALLQRLLDVPYYRRVEVLLRRPVAGLAASTRLKVAIVDFARLPELPATDDVFIALGTTIKAAGSKAAFRRVDFDAVLNTARAGLAAGATRLVVVSALGADSRSTVFYNRVKGEMEDAVAALGYRSLVVVRPSLLVGDRAALGQPARTAEGWAVRLAGPWMNWLPRSVRPIRAEAVAEAMLLAALDARPGVRIIESAEMQRMGRST